MKTHDKSLGTDLQFLHSQGLPRSGPYMFQRLRVRKIMKKSINVWLALGALWLGFPLRALPAPYELVGHWNGMVDVGKFKIRIRLNIVKEADGRLTGTLDVIDQGARGLPIAALLYNEPDVRLEFDQMNTAFTGTLSADHNAMQGTFDEGPGGKPIVTQFKRVVADATTEAVKIYTFKPGEARDIRGYWITSLQPAPDLKLRIGLKVGRNPDGTFEALLDSLDQGGKDIPANTVSVTDRKAKFEWQAMRLVFEAELDPEGNKLTGNWKQGPKPLAVTFDRLEKPATALPDNLSFDPDTANALDLRGTWKGALEIPNQVLRLAFKIGRAPNGTYAGLLVSLDQGGIEIPLTLAVVTNSNVRLESKSIHAVYTGSFTNAGQVIDGKWEQMGNPLPLKLERAGALEAMKKPGAK